MAAPLAGPMIGRGGSGGPGYIAPQAPSFLGPSPGTSGLAPWLKQGVSPLNIQGKLGEMVRGAPSANVPPMGAISEGVSSPISGSAPPGSGPMRSAVNPYASPEQVDAIARGNTSGLPAGGVPPAGGGPPIGAAGPPAGAAPPATEGPWYAKELQAQKDANAKAEQERMAALLRAQEAAAAAAPKPTELDDYFREMEAMNAPREGVGRRSGDE